MSIKIKKYDQLSKANDNNYLVGRLKNHLIQEKYLYHYTITENLDSIKEDGLIPKKYPNSFYENGINGIFLTPHNSLYKINLPESLMELMNEYHENEENYIHKPLIRLTIDVLSLDINKITFDDDYILNKYNYNKAENKNDKIIESLEIWGSIAYTDVIPPKLIISADFNYHI